MSETPMQRQYRAEGRLREYQDERIGATLPATFDEAVQTVQLLVLAFDQACRALDTDTMIDIVRRVRLLAEKVEGRKSMLRTRTGERLMVATEAGKGVEPLWGLRGEFVVTTRYCPALVKVEGLLDSYSFTTTLRFAFTAEVVTWPFLSETGFRSFHEGITPQEEGEGVAAAVRRVLERYVEEGLKTRLYDDKYGHLRKWREPK